MELFNRLVESTGVTNTGNIRQVLATSSGIIYAKGTDAAISVIDKATKGVFTSDSIHPVPLHLRKMFLERGVKNKSMIRIIKGLRRKIQFQQLNLLKNHYPVCPYHKSNDNLKKNASLNYLF